MGQNNQPQVQQFTNLILGSLKPLMGLLHTAKGVAAELITEYGQVY
jgi:hypothetical protein